MENTYFAFISYRHTDPDQIIAKKLHTEIETFRIPKNLQSGFGRKKFGRVFRDQEELPLSPDLGADIEDALLQSEWFIAICSPRYLESRWCMRELEFFIEHKGRDHVLVVLTEGTPEESFPDLIRFVADENGTTEEIEPLAANLCAPDMKGRLKLLRTEKLRLFAPMLGVGFDDLKRRARQRAIRTAAICISLFVLFAACLTTYIVLNHKKNAALKLESAQNSIGEFLQKAASEVAENDRRNAAGTLLTALKTSDENGEIRKEEITDLLRRTMYISPFTQVGSFSNQNVRLTDIVPSPDGSKLIGIVNSNSIACVDAVSNEILYEVSVGNTQINDLNFSPDGTRFTANCDMGRFVTVWSTKDGTEVFRYTSKANQQYHIANVFFWKDSDTLLIQDMAELLIVSSDGTEKLLYTIGEYQDWYDYDKNIFTEVFGKSLDNLFTFNNNDYVGTNIVFTEDKSKILVSGVTGETGTVIIDDEGKLVTALNGMPATAMEHYSISPDGKTVACRSYTGLILFWNAETGELTDIEIFDADNGKMSDVVFSPDSSRFAFVANDTLYVLGAANFSGTLGQSNYVPSLVFSDDSNYLFLSEQNLFIIDAWSGALLSLLETDFSSSYGSAVPLGDFVFLPKNDGSVAVYSMPGSSSVKSAESYNGNIDTSYDPSVPPEGWGGAGITGEHTLTDAFKASTITTDLTPKLRFSRNGQTAALLYPDGVIELFDKDGNGSVKKMIGQLTSEITGFGMTGDILVASDLTGRLMFYDMKADAVKEILILENTYTGFAFNKDGSRMMALRNDGVIDVFSVKECIKLFSMSSPDGFTDFGFSEDGEYAVGRTSSGFVLGNLYQDDSELIAAAKELTGVS